MAVEKMEKVFNMEKVEKVWKGKATAGKINGTLKAKSSDSSHEREMERGESSDNQKGRKRQQVGSLLNIKS